MTAWIWDHPVVAIGLVVISTVGLVAGVEGKCRRSAAGKPHYYHDADANGQVHWVAHQIKEVLERHGYGDLMRLFEAEDEAGFKALDDAPITY